MVLLTLLGLMLAGYIAIVIWIERRKRYWSRRGVPSTEFSIPFVTKIVAPKIAHYQDTEEHYALHKKQGLKHFGSFKMMRPEYNVIDPDVIRNVLSKDFAHFIDRGMYFNEKHDPLSAQLFNMEGQKWRNLRAKLSPTFTSGKMKMMFQTLVDCGIPMVGKVEELRGNKEAIEIKEILACFTTDVIGSCAFGLECNSFTTDSEFRRRGKDFFGMNRWRMYRMIAIAIIPEICNFFGIPRFEKSLTNFYFDVVKDTAKYREENKIVRNDFMHILLELKNNGGLTIQEIAAQAFLFFIAGFETSSTLMYFCVHELTENPDVQEKVREEIQATVKRHDGKITYEGVMEMKYLTQVIDETLRKYPPVPVLNRICVQDYKVPGADVTINAGIRVNIPVYSIHRDPDYYPDPEKFDPDRFTDENKAKRHPYVYLPFGEGPRNCIGLRFGLMQARVGLVLLLKNYRLKVHPKTETPIGISPTSFLMASKNVLYVDLEKL